VTRQLALAASLFIGATSLLDAQQQPPERGQMDGNVSLFAVLTAINAVGYDAGLDSPSANPMRKTVREYIAKKNPPSLVELKKFYETHPNFGLSQYISYALVLDGPPSFHFITTMKELPPDALSAGALSQILERFWEEAELDKLWKQVQPAYEAVLDQYSEKVSHEILMANAFLRNPTSGYLGRRFLIYLDFMAAPNQFETRSYGDDYFVVISSTPKIPIDEIRHAYLFYVLDPLSLKYSNNIGEKRALNQYAQRAPALDEAFKQDFYLLTTACLVKAIETKLAALTPAQRAVKIEEALREGYILTPYFFDHLPIYEKQEKSMRIYYPDLVGGIDVRIEGPKLAQVQWAEKKAPKIIRAVTEAPKPVLNGPAKTLEEADDLYAQKQYEKARIRYADVLKETDIEAYHAKAYYGMARVAAVGKEFELAEKLFQKTLELSPETGVRAWSLFYLGRLSYIGCEPAAAIEHYKKVLEMQNAPANARKAAEEGLQDASKDSAKDKCK
jgi:tetratricopeptide (TPR) repeat protein